MVLAPVGKDHVLRLLYDINTHVGWHLKLEMARWSATAALPNGPSIDLGGQS